MKNIIANKADSGENSPLSAGKHQKIKLFVSDLDGTLLGPDFRISPENAAAIRTLKENGIIFAVATGRIYADAYDICALSGLNPYIVSNNGACIYNAHKVQLYGRWLPLQSAEKVVRFLKEENICHALGTSQKSFVPENWEEIVDLEIEHLYKKGIVVSEERIKYFKDEMVGQTGYQPTHDLISLLKEDSSFYNICVLTFDLEAVARVQAFVATHADLSAFFSSDHSVDIVAQDGSKDIAVAYLAELLQIDRTEIAVVGDGMNDLMMLKKAGIAIAVNNARDEIKAVCGYIAKDFDKHGVADAIRYVLSDDV
jgi:Cof subfamily protein (haloacid dehalogenase superfamily)